MSAKLLHMNVGGSMMITRTSTLTQGLAADTGLTALVRRAAAAGEGTAALPVFLDRDPAVFCVLLNFLRSGSGVINAAFDTLAFAALETEAAYWTLTALSEALAAIKERHSQHYASHSVQISCPFRSDVMGLTAMAEWVAARAKQPNSALICSGPLLNVAIVWI
jgi:hypothetical protein